MGIPNAGSPDPYSVAPPTVNIQAFGQPDMRSFSDSKKDMGDLIPTAIVIKNIPFNVRKEYLTSVMIEMHLPQPYAFNYHFDNGIFRGLAFANFQNAQDTALVIDRMNGLDIQGRKLRVEYKKMLPEHERERIEREKREKRGQLEEQHRGPAHQVSISSLATTTSLQRAPVNDSMFFALWFFVSFLFLFFLLSFCCFYCLPSNTCRLGNFGSCRSQRSAHATVLSRPIHVP